MPEKTKVEIFSLELYLSRERVLRADTKMKGFVVVLEFSVANVDGEEEDDGRGFKEVEDEAASLLVKGLMKVAAVEGLRCRRDGGWR